jgi:hypothetical protein
MYGISRSMLFYYLSEKNTMPLSLVEKLCSNSDVKIAELDGKIEFFESPTLKKIYEPELDNPLLSEFVGIMLGDGYIAGSKPYEVSIVCNSEYDLPYVTQFIPFLFRDLFGLVPKFKKYSDENAIKVYSYSKRLMKYLTKYVRLPANRKRYKNLKIPRIFFANTNLLKACVRGLIDTEGGIYRHHEHLAEISFWNRNESLKDEVFEALKLLDLSPNMGKKCVNIRRKLSVIRYCDEVGFSNVKNSHKYLIWRRTGKVPAITEVKNLITTENDTWYSAAVVQPG